MDEGNEFDRTSGIVNLDDATPETIVSATSGVAQRIVHAGGAVPAPNHHHDAYVVTVDGDTQTTGRRGYESRVPEPD